MPTQYFRFVTRGPAAPRRSAFIEQLLARADSSHSVNDWRAEAFAAVAPGQAMPGVAAAAACAESVTADAVWVSLATPVHYVAQISNVRLPAEGLLTLASHEAETLALDFNRLWAGSGIRLRAGRSGQLFCFFDHRLNVATRDPQELLGCLIEEYLPTGADASVLRRLMSEMEMWLFDSKINRERAVGGHLPLTGFWIWGGGAPVRSLPTLQGWSSGADVFFDAFANEPSMAGVIIEHQAPGGDAWLKLESQWLKPALKQLRAGQLSRIDLSAAERCFSLSAFGSRRFWRRSQPWWESFE